VSRWGHQPRHLAGAPRHLAPAKPPTLGRVLTATYVIVMAAIIILLGWFGPAGDSGTWQPPRLPAADAGTASPTPPPTTGPPSNSPGTSGSEGRSATSPAKGGAAAPPTSLASLSLNLGMRPAAPGGSASGSAPSLPALRPSVQDPDRARSEPTNQPASGGPSGTPATRPGPPPTTRPATNQDDPSRCHPGQHRGWDDPQPDHGRDDAGHQGGGQADSLPESC
jgi:hypothetical protein